MNSSAVTGSPVRASTKCCAVSDQYLNGRTEWHALHILQPGYRNGHSSSAKSRAGSVRDHTRKPGRTGPPEDTGQIRLRPRWVSAHGSVILGYEGVRPNQGGGILHSIQTRQPVVGLLAKC